MQKKSFEDEDGTWPSLVCACLTLGRGSSVGRHLKTSSNNTGCHGSSWFNVILYGKDTGVRIVRVDSTFKGAQTRAVLELCSLAPALPRCGCDNLLEEA